MRPGPSGYVGFERTLRRGPHGGVSWQSYSWLEEQWDTSIDDYDAQVAAQVWEVLRIGGAVGHRLRNAGCGGEKWMF